MLLTFSS